jgi:transcription-repair coupling factor (superfamily II helicase)
VVTEPQLYGERAAQRRQRAARRDTDAVIRSLAELRRGDPVVHEDHGVGRYLGLQALDVGDGVTEFLTLEYQGGDKLYVPVTDLERIHRYTGLDPESAPLHKLGGEAWEKAKDRAREKAHDAAVEILEVQARRSSREGFAFPQRGHQYDAFIAAFPFEETPDQERAIGETLADMETGKPMDRLVCGDVGFGKTEVAMRAAFLAVQGGRQVAVLVPTTLLADQHFRNFSDRFADYPVRIELLSRFRDKREQDAALADIAAGKVDIAIGTHRLLQEDVHFQRLGLVIIDEEHRFGVRQKERLKKLRAEVDVLTMTATPIPRTLNFALAGLRDISLIATAPESRVAVKTFVTEWNDVIVREAIVRELRRGGQVFFLHNDVRTIERARERIGALVPEAEARIAHGQMPERELERVMLDFYHQRFNVLVCSTIIESGIDIPTANTILIERADKFGLAQLHQLRGRVGRSHHRAWCYLIIPPKSLLSADAQKRLDAIASLEELGAGFALASHDLEIRGAGELLGEEQSGQIDEVGFTLYTELLQRAVAALKRGDSRAVEPMDSKGIEIALHAPALLPADYVDDVALRLVLYKRIAEADSREYLEDREAEIVDRFGPMPDPAKRLFRVAALKLRAAPFGIRRIEAGPKGARIEFHAQARVEPTAIIRLLQGAPRVYRMDGPTKLRITKDMPDAAARVAAIEEFLGALSP